MCIHLNLYLCQIISYKYPTLNIFSDHRHTFVTLTNLSLVCECSNARLATPTPYGQVKVRVRYLYGSFGRAIFLVWKKFIHMQKKINKKDKLSC